MSEGERLIETGSLDELRRHLSDGWRIGTAVKNSQTIQQLLVRGIITLVDGVTPDGRRIHRRVVKFV